MANESELTVRINGQDNLTPQLSQLESRLIRFVGAVSSALSALKIASFPIQAIRGFEREMAGVQKTTNFTDTQIKQLGDSLVDLSRRINVSAEDLAKIAAAAGQQGLGREGVEGIRQFSESVSRMAAVLDLTAEDAGTNIGKIASIFKISLRDIESVVSAFNQASNNSTASGEQLLDVVKRIGDAAGSLKLEQSVGLAASAIDFGVSPEVAGTSLSKIFAEFYGRADKFSKLLGVSVNDWMQQLQKDGIGALKMYLDGLRKLSADQQQKVIKELSGGGRIGVLLTKFVQDANNSVLDNNLNNAVQGYRSGTSAIQEQRTVLKTLDAELAKAGNSFQALGIKAGEVFGPRLAAYIAQLNKALADPAVIHFAESVGNAFLDMFDSIATGIKFIADLNVNWENFVQIAKTLIAIRLGQWFLSALSSVPVLGAAMTRLGLDFARSSEQQRNASQVANTAFQTQITRIRELMAQRRAYIQAVEAETQAEIAASRAREAQTAAETRNLQAQMALRQRNDAVNAASGQVTAARGGIATAQAAVAQRAAQVQQQLNERLQRAEQQHQARLTAIVTQGDAARAEARAQGSRAGVRQANLAQAEAIAQEEAYQRRSLAGINAYYARRIQAVQQAGVQEVAAARLAFMQSLSQFDRVAAGPGMMVLTNQARLAASALNQADQAANRANASLTAAQAATTRAAAGFSMLGSALRIVSAGFQALIAIAGRVFFWLSIIYLALDAFGVLENIGAGFQKLTDAMGLTSEASRREAQNQRDLIAAYNAANKARLDAIDGLKAYADASGRVRDDVVTRIRSNLTDSDNDVRSEAMKQLFELQRGVLASQEQATTDIQGLPEWRQKAEADIAAVKAELEKAKKDLEQSLAIADMPVLFDDTGMGAIANQQAVKIAQDRVAALTQSLEDAQKRLGMFTDESERGLNQFGQNAADNAEKVKKVLSELFTQDSAKAFETLADPFIAASKARDDFAKKMSDLNEQIVQAAGDQSTSAQQENLKNLQTAYDEAQSGYAAANGQLQDLRTRLDGFIADARKNNLGDAVLGSLQYLQVVLQQPVAYIQDTLNLLRQVSAEGAKLTGAAAVPTKPTSGTGSFTPTSDSDARRLSRARVELAKAELQALANLEKQANKEREEALEFSYSRSLVSIKEYYAQRMAITRSNLDIELKLRRQELAAIQDEMKNLAADSSTGKNQAEQVRMQAQVAQAQGQIDVLLKQRDALAATTDRELSNAMREFTDSIVEQRNSLVEFFGAATDGEGFQVALEAAQVKYRDFIDKMKANAADFPELVPLIGFTEMMGRFEALESALGQVQREADLTGKGFDNLRDRIDLAVGAGALTRLEGVAALDELRKKEIAYQKSIVDRSRAEIAAAEASGKGLDRNSLRYKELQQTIDDAQLKLEKLQFQGNEVAKEINEGIRGAFEDLFNSIASADTENLLSDFLRSVTMSISEKASEGLSDMIMNALGSSGDGGIGGFFASLFGATSEAGPDGSALNPLYVRLTDGIPGLDGAVADPNATPSSWLDRIMGRGAGDEEAPTPKTDKDQQGVFGTLESAFTPGGLLDSGLSSVVSGVQGVAQAVSGGFGSLLGGLGSLIGQIISAIYASSASSSASSGLGAAGGAFGMAHTGGIIGRTTMRRSYAPVSVFANAVRHHTGGIIGSQPGLQANEVPIIGERGEEVLTKQDPRHRDNLGKGGSGAGTSGDTMQPIFNVQPVLSEQTVLEALQGSQGQKLLLVHIGKQPQKFRQALGIN